VSRILVIDDDQGVRDSMARMLRGAGYTVETAATGEEGVVLAKGNVYDVILSDMRMPGISGLDVLRRLRDQRVDAAFIVMTGFGTVDSAVEAMKLGAVDFVQKPFSPAEIREVVGRVLEREWIVDRDEADYDGRIDLAKQSIVEHRLGEAERHARLAVAEAPDRPEAFNLLGAILDLRGKWLEAQKFYRAALDFDARYAPAWSNLERTASTRKAGKVVLAREVAPEEAADEA
jgi:two-component system, OmpR family, alkaline phosphatase synthesis response regulator PhoP